MPKPLIPYDSHKESMSDSEKERSFIDDFHPDSELYHKWCIICQHPYVGTEKRHICHLCFYPQL